MLNCLLEKDRFYVKNEIGTTKCIHGEKYDENIELIDTPGCRTSYNNESQQLVKFLRDSQYKICGYIIDGVDGIKKIDLRFIRRLQDHNKCVVVLVSKIDLIDKKLLSSYQDEMRKIFYINITGFSSITGYGVDKIIPTMERVSKKLHYKCRTPILNRWANDFEYIKYITQISTQPPHFTIFTTKLLSDNYKKKIQKSLYDFTQCYGVPIKIDFRTK